MLRALVLLFVCLPAYASYSFSGGEITGNLGASYSGTVTQCVYAKWTDHPAANEALYAVGMAQGDNTSQFWIGTASTADRYQQAVTDSADVFDSAFYDSAAGEYDGIWLGMCGWEARSGGREINVETTTNAGSDATSRTVDATDEISIGNRLDDLQDTSALVAEVCLYNGQMSDADMDSFMSGTACNCLADAANVIGY